MLGSQALETAIGLVVMFFVIALASSTIVEAVAQRLGKRAKDLETALDQLLSGNATPATSASGFDLIKNTSVYHSLAAAAKKGKPSYLSARAFADSVMEGLVAVDGSLLADDQIPAGLRKRLQALTREAGNDLQAIKAGLESWFDDAMERLSGAYKRWSKVILFGLGLAIAVTANASTYDTAVNLWKQPSTREAVANAAGSVVNKGSSGTQVKSFNDASKELTDLGLPVGWTAEAQKHWTDGSFWARLATILGWILTALLICLGAPFWFDLLTKLVALRSSGVKPPQAAGDPGSATAQQVAAVTTAAPAVPIVPAPRPHDTRAVLKTVLNTVP